MKPSNALYEMEKKARIIKQIQFISNTIIANACYHTKEMENQLLIAEKTGHMTNEERDIVCKAWEIRNKLALKLMQDLKKYMGDMKI